MIIKANKNVSIYKDFKRETPEGTTVSVIKYIDAFIIEKGDINNELFLENLSENAWNASMEPALNPLFEIDVKGYLLHFTSKAVAFRYYKVLLDLIETDTQTLEELNPELEL